MKFALVEARCVVQALTIMEARFRYAALGDSTAVGVGAPGGGYPALITRKLVETGAKISTMNLGESGATSADLLARQIPAIRGKSPDLITLGIGANDLWRMVDVARFRDTLGRAGRAGSPDPRAWLPPTLLRSPPSRPTSGTATIASS